MDLQLLRVRPSSTVTYLLCIFYCATLRVASIFQSKFSVRSLDESGEGMLVRPRNSLEDKLQLEGFGLNLDLPRSLEAQ